VASPSDTVRNAVIIGLAALLAGAIVFLAVERRDGTRPLEINIAQLTPTPGGPIEVYITGAVARPGVYEMQDGDRVIDVLLEAGGAAPDANLEALNLAVRLRDEDQVTVPRIGQVAPAASSGGSASDVAAAATVPVNINTASARELDDALPGIGEVYSQRIVDSRTRDGPFTSPDDLLLRALIPRATFERIRELVTVGP
jgi:competence protein ComEA